MEEKLDSQAKIIIATNAINYMAHCLFTVNQQIKQVIHLKPEQEEIHGGGIRHREKLLEDTIHSLGTIMIKLGDCMDEHDCMSPIDMRVTKEAFKIIIQGKDDVEK